MVTILFTINDDNLNSHFGYSSKVTLKKYWIIFGY